MKILFIEDDESAIQGIKDFCDEQNYSYKHPPFDEAFAYIEDYAPDILVLDLKNNDEEGFEGCDILDKAWEHNFRPTCIFSGQIVQSTVEQEKYQSPLVCFVDKGDDNPVKEFIRKISPYIDCISEVRKETNKAMRKSFDFFNMAINESITDTAVISSLCSNRIKSYFDNENSNIDMPVWSQYIYPILSDEISTGDIIMLKNCSPNTKTQNKFFIVLSQSCDISHQKISDILVAKCYDIKCLLRKRKISENEYEFRTTDELKTILNTGFCNEFFPLPAIDDILPDITVNLKELKLIPKTKLESDYIKITSLSSPYKERLIWAYMQTACRPGVPDLAIERWCDYLLPSGTDEDVVLDKNIEREEFANDEVKVVCTV